MVRKMKDVARGIAVALIGILAVGAVTNQGVIVKHQGLAMAVVFALGYLGIAFEEVLGFNKSALVLLMTVALWTIRSITVPGIIALDELNEQTSAASEIIFFLLGAMTIVEVVDGHRCFNIVQTLISTKDMRVLLWMSGLSAFCLSAVLDDLTTTITLLSLLRRVIPNAEQRKYCGAAVVLAANAGGAWTPIGDVTTSMLWINGQISSVKIIKALFLPSIVCTIVPLTILSFGSELSQPRSDETTETHLDPMAPNGGLVFTVAIAAMLFVPMFKELTGLPPYLGILFGLGVLWLVTDSAHRGHDGRKSLTVPHALSRVDIQGILFFLGILLSIGCLESAGILKELARFLGRNIRNLDVFAIMIGLASGVIDNVALVAAIVGMYDLSDFPPDSRFWQMVAFSAGTGGSLLITGSAAGIAFMGMEKADFVWYLRKISFPALAGYASGIAVYILTHQGPECLQDVLCISRHLPYLSLS